MTLIYGLRCWLFVSPAFDACPDVRHKLGNGANVSEHAQDKPQKKTDRPYTYRANTGTGCYPCGDYCDWGGACKSVAVFSMPHCTFR